MSRYTSLVVAACLSLPPIVGAQLTAYDESKCASEKGQHEQAAFTTFNSNITTDGPLMWTLKSHSDKALQKWEKSKLKRYWREFTISTPSTLDVGAVTDFAGCGIVFYNVTAALQVADGFNDYPNFSCDTVMNSQCQVDMIQQALNDLDLLSNSSGSDPSSRLSCESLGERFKERAVPQSCNLSTQQPTWGYTVGGCKSPTS